MQTIADKPPILQVSHLSRHFGAIAAVEDLSFELAVGELLALIGPNGAGKTSCFNMLMGQLQPTAGRVLFEGKDVTGMRPRQLWRHGMGRTFQITATWASMTVVENVQLALLSFRRRLFNPFARAYRQHRDEAMGLLELVGLDDQAERAAAVLAYGDLKRLELAIALANRPKLLLLDEPTAGMAPDARGELMRLIGDIVRNEAMSVLFTEHDMDVVFGHAHRVLVLNRGRLIAEGSVEAVRADPLVREVYLGGGRHDLRAEEDSDA